MAVYFCFGQPVSKIPDFLELRIYHELSRFIDVSEFIAYHDGSESLTEPRSVSKLGIDRILTSVYVNIAIGVGDRFDYGRSFRGASDHTELRRDDEILNYL